MRLAALLLALFAGCEGACRGRVEVEQRPIAAPDLRPPAKDGALWLMMVSTIAGERCGSCPAGQVCGAGRCVPERAVPAPGGPL